MLRSQNCFSEEEAGNPYSQYICPGKYINRKCSCICPMSQLIRGLHRSKEENHYWMLTTKIAMCIYIYIYIYIHIYIYTHLYMFGMYKYIYIHGMIIWVKITSILPSETSPLPWMRLVVLPVSIAGRRMDTSCGAFFFCGDGPKEKFRERAQSWWLPSGYVKIAIE